MEDIELRVMDTRGMCRKCGYTIKKGEHYLFVNSTRTRYGSYSTHRLCLVCIYQAYLKINKKELKELLKGRVMEKL